MERLLTPRELRTILARYGVAREEARDKGSHWLFSREFPEGTVTYGVSDREFYDG